VSDLTRGRYEIIYQSVVDIQLPLVFALIPDVVALAEDSPDVGTQSESMGHNLEHDVALMRSIAAAAQGGEAKCMSGIVRQVESAFESELRSLRINEPCPSGPHQSGVFVGIHRFLAERFVGAGEILKWGGHR
jgi:hypothetical protein